MSNGLIICIAVLGFLAVSVICTTIERVAAYRYHCDYKKAVEANKDTPKNENDTRERKENE